MKKSLLLIPAALLCCLAAVSCGTPAPEKGLWEQAGFSSPDQTVATVDGREVPAGVYLYWLSEITDEIRRSCQEQEQTLDWSSDTETGTLAQYAKEQALESAALYATVENWAGQYDCALTEADQTDVETVWQDTAAEHGGQEAYLASLAQKGLDQAGARRMAEDHVLYQKLCRLAQEENSPLWEDASALSEFYTQRGYVTVDLVEVAADAAEEAASLFGRINESADPVAELGRIRQERGQSGYPRTLLPGDGSLPDAYAQAAAALSPGQISGVVEGPDGFAILARLEDDCEAVRLDLLDRRLLDAAADAEITVSQSYQELDVQTFCDALDAARGS